MSDYPDLTPVEPGGEWRTRPRPEATQAPPNGWNADAPLAARAGRRTVSDPGAVAVAHEWAMDGGDYPDAPCYPLDVNTWPCDLCGHGHYPGERCGANGCECRA